jgi:hypothetical protein
MANKGQSPYSTEIAKSSLDYDMNPMAQMLQYKREEEEAKADLVLPYEMGEIPQYLADMTESGYRAASIMENILKSNNFQGDMKRLAKLKNNLEKMVVYLMQEVDPTLLTFTIGAQDRLHSVDTDKN